MIFEREFEVTLTDEMKVEHLVFTYNDNELIIERTHTEPEEGEEDMWNNTDLEILEYDGDEPLTEEEEEEIIDRCFDGDYD